MSLVEDNRSSQEVGTDPEQPVEVSTLTPGTSDSSDMSKLLADSETFRVRRWCQERLCKVRLSR